MTTFLSDFSWTDSMQLFLLKPSMLIFAYYYYSSYYVHIFICFTLQSLLHSGWPHCFWVSAPSAGCYRSIVLLLNVSISFRTKCCLTHLAIAWSPLINVNCRDGPGISTESVEVGIGDGADRDVYSLLSVATKAGFIFLLQLVPPITDKWSYAVKIVVPDLMIRFL